MAKKREVASFCGNFSPVKRRRAILVSRMRHLRGEIGEVLKTRAVAVGVSRTSQRRRHTQAEREGSWELEVADLLGRHLSGLL